MDSHTSDRIKDYLERVLESYEILKKIELEGSTKEDLRKELINIRDSCEELPSLIVQIAKEVNVDYEKIKSFADLFKIDFLEAVKVQIMLLTQPNTPDNIESMKMQSNMSILLMGNYMSTCKFIYALLK